MPQNNPVLPLSPRQDSNKIFSVSEADLLNYIEHYSPRTKATDISIKPYVFEDDTVLFEVTIGNTYKIFSSDKRLPPVYAYADIDENGQISITQNPELYSWINADAKAIKYFKENNPDYRNERYEKEWSRIEAGYTPTANTKAEGDPREGDPGYWRWVSTDTVDISNTVAGHLITTHWHQNSPYNACCPKTSYYETTRCVAGCVAISGAQTLFHLYKLYGVPSTLPSNVGCDGWYTGPNQDHNAYGFHYDARTATQWTNIQNGNQQSIAELIGWLGYRLDMNYSPYDSTAYTLDLVAIFQSEGISSTYTSYAAMTAFNYVFVRNRPVIISSAYGSGRHSYILDRAKKTDYTVRALYEYVPYGNNGVSTGETMYETDHLYEYYVSMNFGWNDTSDNIYFSVNYWNSEGISISSDGRYMLYNFGVIN